MTSIRKLRRLHRRWVRYDQRLCRLPVVRPLETVKFSPGLRRAAHRLYRRRLAMAGAPVSRDRLVRLAVMSWALAAVCWGLLLVSVGLGVGVR